MILGVIPARAGSKGIENKNMYQLHGKSLIEYTYESAIYSNIGRIRISTNDNNIIKKYGKILCYERDKSLSQDDTPMIPVIRDVIKRFEDKHLQRVDVVMLLQPTSPLRTTEDINKAIELFNSSKADSLYSGYYIGIKNKRKVYDKHNNKPYFQRNGAIFITSRDLLYKGKIWSDNVIEFEMPSYRSIDIDNMDDMRHAELLIKGGVLDG